MKKKERERIKVKERERMKEKERKRDGFVIKFLLPITFNNPVKACFSTKKYRILLYTIQTRPAQIVISIFLNGV